MSISRGNSKYSSAVTDAKTIDIRLFTYAARNAKPSDTRIRMKMIPCLQVGFPLGKWNPRGFKFWLSTFYEIEEHSLQILRINARLQKGTLNHFCAPLN